MFSARQIQMNNMRFLGIDPGYDRVGIAIVEKNTDSKKEEVIFSECFETDKKLEVTDRLHKVGQRVAEVIELYKPDALALETLFFSNNQKTAMAVSSARGIMIYLAQNADCVVYEYHPQEIKVAITGYGKSDKTAVTAMVKQLVANCPEKAKDDEYDAIAIAVTGLAHNGHTQ
jgi:crossover junction endodeoxyribonuclease RuvC